MKVIAHRVFTEPAVFLGLLASIALAIITIATGDPWDAAAIAGIVAPLASALGIRQLVVPETKVDEMFESYTAPPPSPLEPPDST